MVECTPAMPLARSSFAPAHHAPGSLATSSEWIAVARQLEAIARHLRNRMRKRGRFNVALASFIAAQLLAAAAEIRANLALEEMTACQNRS